MICKYVFVITKWLFNYNLVTYLLHIIAYLIGITFPIQYYLYILISNFHNK